MESVAAPPTGPQAGVDRPGSDMPGYPKALPSADPNLCWKACNDTSGCVAWAYGIPKCGFGASSQPLCWLKSAVPGSTSNACRISGAQVRRHAVWLGASSSADPDPLDQGEAGGAMVNRPLINGKFTFLAGWLDQSFWPDGLYRAPTDEALAFDVKVRPRAVGRCTE